MWIGVVFMIRVLPAVRVHRSLSGNDLNPHLVELFFMHKKKCLISPNLDP
jgi:hypothetical protein